MTPIHKKIARNFKKEVDQLAKEINRISENTEFNTKKLINGDVDGDGNAGLVFHIGANEDQSITLEIEDMSADALGVTRDAAVTGEDALGIDISTTQGAANTAIDTINQAIEDVSAERSNLGAVQNRLEHTISNLDNASENLSAAESRIRDVDMAAEMMEMTRANILSQASQSMLAQANQQPQSVLQLLG